MGIKFSTTVPKKTVKPTVEQSSAQQIAPHTSIDYCHEVSIAIGINGSVTPSSVILGNYGDINITRLTINLDDLKKCDEKHYNLSLYDHLLLIKNTTNNTIESYDCNYDAAKNQAYLEIPGTITSTLPPGRYKLIYVLQEQDAANGSTSHAEQFVSDEFSGIINATSWDTVKDFNFNDVPQDTDILGFLTKPSINISLVEGNNYKIYSISRVLGNKGDKFIKRLTWKDPVFTEWNLDKVYVVFSNAHLTALTRFTAIPTYKNLWTAWVPQEITEYAEPCSVFIISIDGTSERRWISNSLQFEIKDNFLGGEWTPMSAEGLMDEEGYFIKDKNDFFIQLEEK